MTSASRSRPGLVCCCQMRTENRQVLLSIAGRRCQTATALIIDSIALNDLSFSGQSRSWPLNHARHWHMQLYFNIFFWNVSFPKLKNIFDPWDLLDNLSADFETMSVLCFFFFIIPNKIPEQKFISSSGRQFFLLSPLMAISLFSH